jgi:6-pyruvoyltetrahydropterin/6-carboxytetrahydropterin synthase
VYSIGKRFSFDAAHRSGCDREISLHGHTFVVEVRVTSDDLVQPGFVVDFGDLKPVNRYIDDVLDHRLLEDVLADTSVAGVAEHLESWCENHLRLPSKADLEVHAWAPARASTSRGLADWEITFEAAHQLPGLAAEHKCGRMHGHSYAVGVRISQGCPVWKLQPLRTYAATELDHSVLNDVLACAPTSENLAAYLHEWCTRKISFAPGDLMSVVVSETASTWAEFRL